MAVVSASIAVAPHPFRDDPGSPESGLISSDPKTVAYPFQASRNAERTAAARSGWATYLRGCLIEDDGNAAASANGSNAIVVSSIFPELDKSFGNGPKLSRSSDSTIQEE